MISRTVRSGGRSSGLDDPKHNWNQISVHVIEGKSQNDRRAKDDGEENSPSVQIRRLTPMECERLQGYPDKWTYSGIIKQISDSQRYKCLGNAVSVPVTKEIFRRLYIT